MITRIALAAVLAVLGCHVRVLLAPGVPVPLPVVALAALGTAAAALAVLGARIIRRDGWQLCPCWRTVRPLAAPRVHPGPGRAGAQLHHPRPTPRRPARPPARAAPSSSPVPTVGRSRSLPPRTPRPAAPSHPAAHRPQPTVAGPAVTSQPAPSAPGGHHRDQLSW
jgi:hypothetical protein